MRKIVRQVVEFECKVCKTTYDKKEEAEKCENKPVEVKLFKKGDRVTIIGYQHTCDYGRGAKKDRNFFAKGIVTKILRREPMDEDYSRRWLGGKLFDHHIFPYIVEFECLCGKNREGRFFSPEIKKNSR